MQFNKIKGLTFLLCFYYYYLGNLNCFGTKYSNHIELILKLIDIIRAQCHLLMNHDTP